MAKLSRFECVRDLRHVGDAIIDAAALLARRAAVAGAVVADQPNSLFARQRFVGLVDEARRRRAVVEEHGVARRVAALVDLELSPVVCLDRLRHRASLRLGRRQALDDRSSGGAWCDR